MNSNFVGLRATVGRVLGLLGILCAVVGIFAAALNVVSMGISGLEHPEPWVNSHGVERP